METAIIILSVAVTTLFLLVGTLLGWLVKDYLDQTRMPFIHPEMFDEEGNMIRDELIYIRPDIQYWDDLPDDEDD